MIKSGIEFHFVDDTANCMYINLEGRYQKQAREASCIWDKLVGLPRGQAYLLTVFVSAREGVVSGKTSPSSLPCRQEALLAGFPAPYLCV